MTRPIMRRQASHKLEQQRARRRAHAEQFEGLRAVQEEQIVNERKLREEERQERLRTGGCRLGEEAEPTRRPANECRRFAHAAAALHDAVPRVL